MRRNTFRSLANRGMLLACLGMLGGMAVDASQGGISLLTSLCAGSDTLSLGQITRLHWICLPFMHLGTLAGSLAPALVTRRPSNLLSGLACAAWMVMGMNLGSYLLPHAVLAAEGIYNTTALLAGMMGGMGASMMSWAFLDRRAATSARQARAPQQSHKKAFSVT